MRSLTYVDIKHMCFCLCQWKQGTDLRIQNIYIYIFLYFIKISCQTTKESPLSKQSSLPPSVQPHPFQKKYFIPTVIANLQEVNPSLCKGGQDLNYANAFWNLYYLSNKRYSTKFEKVDQINFFFQTMGYLWPVAALKSTPQKRFHTKVTFTFNSHFQEMH